MNANIRALFPQHMALLSDCHSACVITDLPAKARRSNISYFLFFCGYTT